MRPRDRQLLLFDVSQQWVSKSMKEAALEAGLDLARAHPHALRNTYGRNAVLNEVPTPVLQQWLGHRSLAETERYVQLRVATTTGRRGCEELSHEHGASAEAGIWPSGDDAEDAGRM